MFWWKCGYRCSDLDFFNEGLKGTYRAHFKVYVVNTSVVLAPVSLRPPSPSLGFEM